ncbi:Holliday junction resolvase RuvX [Bacteriovoracaceae bacterium]|nr:Holliday junction resolvase RuvX [Bacteriovoracaceae bacterium]
MLITTTNPSISGKKIMAIDYGERVSGLAFFHDGIDFFPAPIGKIIEASTERLIAKLRKFVLEYEADVVVIGVPKFTDGKKSKMTLKVEKFASTLQNEISPIPLFCQDETLSTFDAKERMKNSPLYNFKVDYGKIDEVSAAIILEDFLKQ